MPINGRDKVGIEVLKNPKTFIDCSQTIDDVHENLEDYNSTNKKRVLTVLDDTLADMESNKKFYSHWIVLKRKKTQYFACFYVIILFQSAYNYKAKCNTLFYHENS